MIDWLAVGQVALILGGFALAGIMLMFDPVLTAFIFCGLLTGLMAIGMYFNFADSHKRGHKW